MTQASVTLHNLGFPNESMLRFGSGKLSALSISSYTVDNVNLHDGYGDMVEFSVDLPYGGTCDYTYAVIGTHGYWVMAYAFVGNKAATVRWNLRRDPFYESVGQKVKGEWARLPSRTAPYLKDVIGNTELVVTQHTRLPSLADIFTEARESSSGVPEKLLWVTVNVTRSASSTESKFTKYGFFVGSKWSMQIDSTQASIHGGQLHYPTLKWVMDDIDTLLALLPNTATVNGNAAPITEEDIVSVCISERCPYKVLRTGDYRYGLDGVSAAAYKEIASYTPSGASAAYEKICMIQLPPSLEYEFREFSMTYTEAQRVYGQAQLKDNAGNPLAVLPMDNGSYTFAMRTVDDVSAIFTEVYLNSVGTFTPLQQVLRFPEGQLPFVGNTWNTYNANERAFDRESMERAIDQANANALLNAGSSVVGGVVTGALVGNIAGAAIGGVTTIIGLGTTLYSNKIEADRLRAEQDSKERQYRVMTGTTYNLGYSPSYAFPEREAGIDILMPNTLTNTQINRHAEKNGYPAVGHKEVTLSKGFFRGKAESAEGITNKHLYDILNADLMAGIRIIEARTDI